MNYDFQIVNADTDSISFCKPDLSFLSVEERKALVKEINDISPEFMDWADDGYYKKVVILRAKNYILQKEDGKITYKGSAIKDQKKEPALREFMKAIIDEILNETYDYLSVYNRYMQEILNMQDISRWCSKKTITPSVLNAKRKQEQDVLDAIKGTEYVEGDKVYVFFKKDKSLCLKEKFGEDYSKKHLLKRLHDTAKIFKNIIDVTQFTNYSLVKKLKELGIYDDNVASED